jgi:hypothetical protein
LRRTFFVRAIWDDEAQVYVSESDIKGLHIETKTLDEFKQVLDDVAVELILTNHVDRKDLTLENLADLLPGVIWERPLQLYYM